MSLPQIFAGLSRTAGSNVCLVSENLLAMSVLLLKRKLCIQLPILKKSSRDTIKTVRKATKFVGFCFHTCRLCLVFLKKGLILGGGGEQTLNASYSETRLVVPGNRGHKPATSPNSLGMLFFSGSFILFVALLSFSGRSHSLVSRSPQSPG